MQPALDARKPGTAPAGFNFAAFFEGIHWHQRWQLFEDVWVSGPNPVRELCACVGLPADLRGQRVLDVGAWNGCFSFECERRGAEEVVALSLEDPAAVGFNRLREVLGSKVRYVQQSIYALEKDDLGEFDIVLFFGVLYHLRYPLLAIDRIRNVCRGTTFIETHVIDRPRSARGWLGRRLRSLSRPVPAVPLWRFYKDGELANDCSNWFGPNIAAVMQGFESAGFAVELCQHWEDRAAFRASVARDLRQALAKTCEGHYQANREFIGI